MTMAKKPLDTTKPVQTRDGRKARILGTLAGNLSFPIVAAITTESGREVSETYTVSGHARAGREYHTDLLNVPEAYEQVLAWLDAPQNSHFKDAVQAFHSAGNKIAGIKFIRSVIPASVTGFDVAEGCTTGCGLVAAKEAYEAIARLHSREGTYRPPFEW